jgi:hypothetical protein
MQSFGRLGEWNVASIRARRLDPDTLNRIAGGDLMLIPDELVGEVFHI